MIVGDLFSGIGGFSLAAHWMGWRTAWFSEIDPFASRVLAHHWPDVPNLGDITAIDFTTVELVDILVGGFPCQDISHAGKKEGITGSRSRLWKEYVRAIREVRPRYVVVENVAALVNRGLDVVLGDLAEIGYDAEWGCFSAADMGAPHKRERFWLLAYPNNTGLQRREWVRAASSTGESNGYTGKRSSAVDDTDGGRREQRDAGVRQSSVAGAGYVSVGNAQQPRLEGHVWHERSDICGRHDTADGVAVADTIGQRGCSGDGERQDAEYANTSGEAVGYWDNAVAVEGCDGTVRLIPREAAQEGPESPLWPVADGVPGKVARLRGIGNAIVPQCAVEIFRSIDGRHTDTVTA